MKRISINETEYAQIKKDLEEFEQYKDIGEEPMVKALQLVGCLRNLISRAYTTGYDETKPQPQFQRNGRDFGNKGHRSYGDR